MVVVVEVQKIPYVFCTSTTTTMYLWYIVEKFYYLPEVHSSSTSRSTKEPYVMNRALGFPQEK